MKYLQLLLQHRPGNYSFVRNLKPTLRFVALVATPLSLINSFVGTYGSADFLAQWANRFAFSLIIIYPQAVVYVSLIKWYDSKR
ncbi:hypothetical protein [Pontibacter kalidii]|uniref:hypothetical protein n=1 Tax=Pontibacter kalidii TaxID=2592049 RepID=UPI0022556A5F|nr:hypothetical protein [Pontibacter kalidii]